MMDVVSPTSVAAPCRLDDTEIERIIPTGSIFNFLHMASPIGATISTVDTLSMKADIMPAKSDMRMVTHMAFLLVDSSMSARRTGIPESIK